MGANKSTTDTFARRIVGVYGDKGQAWLARLPTIIAACEEQWSLSHVSPLTNLSYNYVAVALRDEVRVVLKLGVPNPGLDCEIEALRHFGGRGAVKLLEADRQRGALLLEGLVPGETLASLSDEEEATRIAARVMRRLWRPPDGQHAFPTVAEWASGLKRLRQRFEGQTGPLPRGLVEKAESLFQVLLNSMDQPVLLHGDCHHDNILSHGSDWVVIDPKGVIGERAYEVARFLHNPVPGFLNTPNPRDVVLRRVEIFGDELGLDQGRLLAWGFCKTVLSAWWSIEDHNNGWQYAISCANILNKLVD